MLLKNEANCKSIQSGFTLVFGYTKLANTSNLQDINTFLENFFCSIINKLYKSALVNLNTYNDQNYPGVDLGDEKQKLCFQITATCVRAKISSTITKFESHNLFDKYTHLRFLLIELTKRKYDPFVTNGKYIFDKDKDILFLNDIFNEIVHIADDETIEGIAQYITGAIQPLFSFFKDKQTLETIIFQELFKTFSLQYSSSNDEQKTELPDNSDLNIKKSRFTAYWSFIKDTYADIFDSNREKMYEINQSSFSEEDQIRVKEYLKLESRKVLFSVNNNPIKAIDLLTSEMIQKFNLNFITETEVKYFLYYQLYQCYVFPNPN